MRTTPRAASYKPPTPPTPSRPSLLKKLIREELRDRSVKGLCWHCDKPWSRDHPCKKGHLLLIKAIEDLEEEVQEHGVVTEEEQQLTDYMMHALAGYANPCPRMKLLLYDQEIIADFFLFLLTDYQAILGIE
ncbi:hypothetical protein B296_00022134 [Ensete ventricosum]|uniref:Uncharacterized protein n=1 Tax=Ensete ventricosum TaxID=4639 RepID=A0A426Y142_ENSVE|nr:hypothetical protein B296_00022134 [Ensete ventricosum]